jgi:hypothetical protein
MAFTTIEPMAAYQGTPPIVPPSLPKSAGFSAFPPGTELVYDGGKWALYYYAPSNVSYMVIDVGTAWRIKPIIGRVKLSYAKSHARHVRSIVPCCQEE